MFKKEDIIKYAVTIVFSSIIATISVMSFIHDVVDTERCKTEDSIILEREKTNASFSKLYTRYDMLENDKLEKEVFYDFRTMYIRDQADIKSILHDILLNTLKTGTQVGKLEGRILALDENKEE